MPEQDVHKDILTCIKNLVDTVESWAAVCSAFEHYSNAAEIAELEQAKDDARRALDGAIEAMRIDTIRAVEERERAAKNSKLREASELAFALAHKIKEMK